MAKARYKQNLLSQLEGDPMQSSGDHLFAAAMQLPDTDRANLAFQLLESLPDDIELVALDDPEFLKELDRRFADQAGAIPWSQLRSEG